MNSLWLKLFLIPVYLFITALPLASPVGANLEYEYSLMAGWLALILLPLFALFIPAQFLPRSDGRFYVAPALEFFWIFLIGPAIALLSPGWMFFSGLCPCSKEGFAFWAIAQTFPAWVLAHAAMWAVLRARVMGASRWRIFSVLAVLLIGLIALDAARLWYSPQKRLTSFFSGFLHGPIYDDLIIVDHGIMLARLSHLLLAGALLAIVWMQKSLTQRGLWAAAVITVGAWAGAGIAASGFPSTTMGKAALDSRFKGRIDGAGFTMYYVRSASADADDTDGRHPLRYRRLARDTDFHLKELTKDLGLTNAPHVHVYVYPDERTKKLWFGGGSTDVADVRTPSIHIDDNTWPHPTLRHELVHAVASGVAFHGLGFHPNMAITEGLAVALAPDGRSLSLDDGAASLLESGRLRSIEGLFSPMFWRESGGRAYTVAGSFLKFLIQQAGAQKVLALYGGDSFAKVFGQDQQKIIEEWRTHVTAGFDRDRHAVFSEALFRHPGVFADLCPHSKVDLNRRRDADIYARMRQPLNWDPEEDYLPWRAKLDPQDRGVRLRIWRKAIHDVVTARLPAAGRIETWRTAVGKFRRFPPKTLEDVEAGILESDLARVLGDRDGSLKILNDLQDAGKKSFLGFSFQREVAARLAIEAEVAFDQALEWRRFLAGWRRAGMPDEPVFSGPWITTYLKLRNLRADRWSAVDLEQALALQDVAVGLPETFRHEWHKIIAGRLMQTGAFAKAAESYRAAGEASSGSLRALMDEHARRAEFYQATGAL